MSGSVDVDDRDRVGAAQAVDGLGDRFLHPLAVCHQIVTMWALASLRTPWVAQRVWAMPVRPRAGEA